MISNTYIKNVNQIYLKRETKWRLYTGKNELFRRWYVHEIVKPQISCTSKQMKIWCTASISLQIQRKKTRQTVDLMVKCIAFLNYAGTYDKIKMISKSRLNWKFLHLNNNDSLLKKPAKNIQKDIIRTGSPNLRIVRKQMPFGLNMEFVQLTVESGLWNEMRIWRLEMKALQRSCLHLLNHLNIDVSLIKHDHQRHWLECDVWSISNFSSDAVGMMSFFRQIGLMYQRTKIMRQPNALGDEGGPNSFFPENIINRLLVAPTGWLYRMFQWNNIDQ